MDRQTFYVSQTTRGLQHTRGWIFFIDDDELIHHKEMGFEPKANRSRLLTFLKTRLTDASPVGHLNNHEARASVSNNGTEDMFTRSTHFETDKSRFHAYTNGKGVAFLGKHNVYGFGPHRFRAVQQNGKSFADTLLEGCVILHCDSMTFAKWRTKFSRAIPNSVSTIPYYSTSAKLVTNFKNDNVSLRRAYDKLFIRRSELLHLPLIQQVLDRIFYDPLPELSALFKSMTIENGHDI